MTFPAPPLEGFVVVVQHRPDVARRLEAALSHAGAKIFTALCAAETLAILERYQAGLVVLNTNDSDGVFNEQVVFEAFHRKSGRICFPKYGLITLSTWLDLNEPASAVVEEATRWRRRLNE